jgi:predicted PurR-regulated permease PerM
VVASLFAHLPGWARSFLAEHNLDSAADPAAVSDAALKGGQYLAGSAFLIGKGTFGFTVSFGIMLYLLFFLLKDGPYLVLLILESLPLSSYVKQHLFAARRCGPRHGKRYRRRGAGAGGAGWLCLLDRRSGRQHSVGSADGVSVAYPGGGSDYLGASGHLLFATGQLWQGAFIVGFFVIVIGLVDNILRPLLVGKDTRMPDLILTTLGGMEIYGINGFVIGPLIAALFIACWNLLSGREHAGNTDEIDEEFIEEAKNSRNE